MVDVDDGRLDLDTVDAETPRTASSPSSRSRPGRASGRPAGRSRFREQLAANEALRGSCGREKPLLQYRSSAPIPSTGSRSWRLRTAHRPAVGERLVDGEIEPALVRLEARAVERAFAVRGIDAAAGGALERLAVDAVLEEQHFDAAARRPPACRSNRQARPFRPTRAPALDRILLRSARQFSEHGVAAAKSSGACA